MSATQLLKILTIKGDHLLITIGIIPSYLEMQISATRLGIQLIELKIVISLPLKISQIYPT